MSERERVERWFTALLFGVVLTFGLTAFVDPDLAGHLVYGLDHLAHGRLPWGDPYAYTTAGRAWINHEWGFELTLGLVYTALGSTGLVLLQALGWGLTGALILRLVRRATRDFVPGALAFLAFVALAFAAITIRPHLVTYLLFAVLLTLLEVARAGRQWALVPAALLTLPWANAHGGWLAGWCVLAAYSGGLALDALLGRAPRGDLPAAPRRPGRLAAAALGATAVAGLASLVNPYGPGLHAYMIAALGKPRPQISEWRPVELDPQGALFLGWAALVFVALAARARRDGLGRTPLPHALVLIATCALSVRHARHTPFFAMAAAAFASGALADLYRAWVPAPRGDLEPGAARRLRWLSAALLIPALAVNLSWPRRDLLTLQLRPVGGSSFPTGALEFLRAHLREHRRAEPHHLLVQFDWAQLAIAAFWPDARVFYDGRFRTAYDAPVEDAYFAFTSAAPDPAWRDAITRWPTDLVLLPADRPAAARLEREPGWRVAYRDVQAVVFERVAPGEVPPPPALGGQPPPSLPFADWVRPRPD